MQFLAGILATIGVVLCLVAPIIASERDSTDTGCLGCAGIALAILGLVFCACAVWAL